MLQLSPGIRWVRQQLRFERDVPHAPAHLSPVPGRSRHWCSSEACPPRPHAASTMSSPWVSEPMWHLSFDRDRRVGAAARPTAPAATILPFFTTPLRRPAIQSERDRKESPPGIGHDIPEVATTCTRWPVIVDQC